MNKPILILTIIVASLIAYACKDLFDAQLIKQNPNAASNATIDVLLSGTLTGLGVIIENTDTRIGMMWSGQLTGLNRQHLSYARYIVSPQDFDWGNEYPVASQARLIQQKSSLVNNKQMQGVGQVIEAIIIGKVAALYGDIPYSQAFEPDLFATPQFDKQSSVYKKIHGILDEAIRNLSSKEGSPASGKDFIYQNNFKKWKAAAYSLKARLYMHTGDYSNAIEKALHGIESPDYDFLIPHGFSPGYDRNLNYNFFAKNWIGDTGCSPPAFLPGFMMGHSNSKTDETALFQHYFMDQAYTEGLDPNAEDGFFAINAPYPVVTFFETQLILAESYARLNDIPNAVAHLNQVRRVLSTGQIYGLLIQNYYQTMGLKYDPYTENDFLPGALANPTSTGRNQQNGLLYEIITQKYILSYGQIEAYNDIRRWEIAVPFVQLPISPIIATPTGRIPDRFVYPQSEINTNPNVPKVGGDVPNQWQKLEIFD
ncbi:MAG: SusD/RagB family nutrient-binding outer membrane lipoprotein [Bacteroidetes bacterium]|nr:SusD/RagB family nutrient-binding outer membrane lipoprotein [Bacteroidota bacterium]